MRLLLCTSSILSNLAAKDKISVGDRVKIVVPNTFIRCGYPLTLKDTKKEVENLYKKEILDASKSMNFINFHRFKTFLASEYIQYKKGG